MKMVIDIPDEIYKKDMDDRTHVTDVLNAVRNGSPLPEQQPCENCINRQTVDTLVDELARAISDERCYMSRGRSTTTIMQDILDLPPVTPQLKIGRWLAKSFHEVYCDNCGFDFDIMTNEFMDKMKYCPNCGAKMEGEDETDN